MKFLSLLVKLALGFTFSAFAQAGVVTIQCLVVDAQGNQTALNPYTYDGTGTNEFTDAKRALVISHISQHLPNDNALNTPTSIIVLNNGEDITGEFEHAYDRLNIEVFKQELLETIDRLSNGQDCSLLIEIWRS